jgi:hypothetical protein
MEKVAQCMPAAALVYLQTAPARGKDSDDRVRVSEL